MTLRSAPLALLLPLILILGGCAPGPTPAPSASATATPSAPPTAIPSSAPSPVPPDACAGAPAIYHPQRLTPLGACATFRGIVLANLHEKDGDHHLWVAPDPGYETFLSGANVFHGAKALVAEIVPACTTEPADSTAASHCPASTLPEPAVRDHVELVGPWVADTVHGSWHELHPVTKVTVLPPAPGAMLRGLPTAGPGDADLDE